MSLLTSVVRRVGILFLSFFFFIEIVFAQLGPFGKSADDIDRKYTNVGNIGLTVTNFGTIGTRNFYWPRQPSCEYPRGSRIEHVYQGGLWVGAVLRTRDSSDRRNGLTLVSTGATDRSGEGYEFNAAPDDSITELSILTDDRPQTAAFSPLAVSHQDFVCDYADKYTHSPVTGDSILNHTPLGISIHQESYSWNFPFADFFVILRYVITNASVDTLDSVYVGFWDNAVVHNTNYVRPGTVGYFDNTGQGFDAQQRMAYSFDFNGAPGGPAADSYMGLRLLGTTPFPSGVDSLGDLAAHTFYNAWRFRASIQSSEEVYVSPTDDNNSNQYLSRYSRLTQSIPQENIDPLRVSPINVTYLLSTGPWSRINPGESIEVVYAVICAKKAGTAPASLDTKPQRANLYANAAWAQQAYNGEDVNGNDILDPGEDIARRDSVSPTELGLRYEPDGKITRYLLPAPPKRPKVRVDVQDQKAVIYWDKSTSEESVDPILGTKDFEGYRIYRSNAGDDFLNHDNFVLNPPLVGEFDRSDDQIGRNTGFGQVLLRSPKIFPCDTFFTSSNERKIVCDTIQYWYRFPPEGIDDRLLNGWQYMFGVSAFDKGDSVNDVPSLESAKSLRRVIPGTPPRTAGVPVAPGRPASVGVYPNPYYANAYWDGNRERLRKIYFYNLPPRCEITVYTLAGDVVTVIEHDSRTYAGEGIDWFSQFGDPATKAQFAGGEHAWDLITKWDQAIATGLYLFTVKDEATGDIDRGKFMIIK